MNKTEKQINEDDPGKVQIGSYLGQPLTSRGKIQLGYYGATPPTPTGQVLIGKYESWETACNPNIIL
jgi:hypothetical protein